MVDMNDTLSAQVAVIGSLLLDSKLLGEVLLKVSDKDFITAKCRMVFQAMRSLFTAQEPVDPVTVRNKLGGHTDDEWSRFLLEAMEATPTTVNLWVYVDLMKTQAQLNQLNQLGGLLQVTADMDKAKEYIAMMNAALCESTGPEVVSLQTGLTHFLENVDKPRVYIPWGLAPLNTNIHSKKGSFVIVGGRPSAGKTALSIMFGMSMAKTGLRVAFFSLETDEEMYFDRLVAHLARVEMDHIKKNALTDEDIGAVTESATQVKDMVFDFIPASAYTAGDIEARSLAGRYDVIFIDYVQLIKTPWRGSRNDKMAEVSMSLHRFAQDSKTLVVALSQLSRPQNAAEGFKTPSMSSLRDSGQFEQDADTVMILSLEDDSNKAGSRVLSIVKNKDGTLGEVTLAFDGAYQTFRQGYRETTPPKRRESDYKQVSFTELSRREPVPFEGAG